MQRAENFLHSTTTTPRDDEKITKKNLFLQFNNAWSKVKLTANAYIFSNKKRCFYFLLPWKKSIHTFLSVFIARKSPECDCWCEKGEMLNSSLSYIFSFHLFNAHNFQKKRKHARSGLRMLMMMMMMWKN